MMSVDDVLSGRASWAVKNADCLEGLRAMPGGCVGAVVSDPPYGTDVPRDGYGRRRLGARHIEGDSDLSAFAASLPLLRPLLCSADCWLAFYCSPKNRYDFETCCREAGLSVLHEVVWDKMQPGLGGGIRYRHETLLLCSFGKPKGRCELFSVLAEHVSCTPRKLHPHQKPVGVTARVIEYAAPDAALILDPFCGSGTTGVAARSVGRRFVGFEVSAEYAAHARRRIAAEAPLADLADRNMQPLLFGGDRG